jgi:hypothetical protein
VTLAAHELELGIYATLQEGMTSSGMGASNGGVCDTSM